jgi:PPOX class probable F420-dependent enzyme
MELEQAISVARDHHQSTLTTIRSNGRPQLSNVLHAVADDGTIRVSITTGRAKYTNAQREPWVALHLNGENFWSYVVIEGEASLSEPAADPHDDTVEALVELYRSLSGEHEDWDDYRRAMVEQQRVVLAITPTRAYGLLR